MPLRSRELLLAGMGGLLALGLVAGCQTRSLQNDGLAPPPVAMGLPRSAAMSPVAAADAPPALVSLAPVAGARSVSSEQDNTSVQASSWRFADHFDNDGNGPGMLLPPRGALNQVAGTEVTPGSSAPAELVLPTTTTAPSTRPPTIDEPPQLHMPAPLVTAPNPTPISAPPSVPVIPIASGPAYGPHGLPREGAKQALPPYVVEPPDILLIQASAAVLGSNKYRVQPLEGPHLVRPDGTVDLGIYGQVFVAGMTLADVKDQVARQLLVTGARTYRDTEKNADGTVKMKDGVPVLAGKPKEFTLDQIKEEVRVDVIGYNSKWYYIITSGAGWGEMIYKVPVTGNETVLDALAYIQGLPVVASQKKVFLARPTTDPNHPLVVNIDYRSMTHGSASCNYQLFPNDRIYVGSDPWLKADGILAKRFAPLERILGITLLGSSTVNSISGRTSR